MEPEHDAAAAAAASSAAVREKKRLDSQRKRDAERAELDKRAEAMRSLRARRAAEADAPPPPPRRVVNAVHLACGVGGSMIAIMMLQQLACFANVEFRSAFAGDYDASKLVLFDAAAAAMVPPQPAGVVSDMTDRAFFTPQRVAGWGPLHVLASSVPCTSLSSLGKRDGLRNKAVAAFIAGLLHVIGLALAPIVMLECTKQLEHDPRFKKLILAPLRKLGYSFAIQTLDARHWVGAARLRMYLVAFRSAAACEAFSFPAPPPSREVRLWRCILPAFDPRAPAGTRMASASSYFVTRIQRRKLAAAMQAAQRAGRKQPTAKQLEKAQTVGEHELSIAARAISQLPLISKRGISHVVTFHFGRVTAIEHTYGVAPTLTTSGTYMLRDAFGVRAVSGAETARLHGYPEPVVAAFEAAAGSSRIVSAIGDGFCINVVRDVLKAALRAVAGAEGE
jgi:site-specific DNA-cytosine methylase